MNRWRVVGETEKERWMEKNQKIEMREGETDVETEKTKREKAEKWSERWRGERKKRDGGMEQKKGILVGPGKWITVLLWYDSNRPLQMHFFLCLSYLPFSTFQPSKRDTPVHSFILSLSLLFIQHPLSLYSLI